MSGADQPVRPVPTRSLKSVVGQLTGLNVLVTAFGFATGPILARALDADGRGVLAAIQAPLSLAPLVLVLGLTTFATSAIARGVSVAGVSTTIGGLAAWIGLAFIPLGLFGAEALSAGDPTVERYLQLGAILMPFTLYTSVVGNIAMGLERWDLLTVQRLIPPVGAFVAYTTLFLLDELTVSLAAMITIALGVLSALPPLWALAGTGRAKFDRALAGRGLRFGSQVWFITLGQVLNQRLDQIVLFQLASARELGLYAVAVTISGLPGLVSGAVAQAVMPRVAGGRTELLASSLRFSLLIVAVIGAGVAAVSPVVVPFVFGESFRDAVPMVQILMLASLANTGPNVLGSSLAVSLQRPGIAGVGEILSLVVTAGGLALLLPPLGGIGAAIVSVAAYGVNCAWLVGVATRKVGGRVHDYLVPTRADIGLVISQLAGLRRRRGVANDDET